ncbi:hypothetical protein Tco_0486722 [Tanacetum coccineum]
MASNEETNAAGTDTRPPMLVESDYDSWKIRIHSSEEGPGNVWKYIARGKKVYVTTARIRTSMLGSVKNSKKKAGTSVLQDKSFTDVKLKERDFSSQYMRIRMTSDLDEGPQFLAVAFKANLIIHYHLFSIWDMKGGLGSTKLFSKKDERKPGHVRPANTFYEKLNALMFVPQKDLSGDQAYWLSANEIASQASKSATPATPFVRKSRPPSQVLTSLRNVNAVFPQFEGIIKERTTQRPDYVSEWCFDYAKQFVEQQLVPFYDHFKKHIQAANDTFFKEIKEFEQIFDELEAEYEQCVLDNKNLTIEKKNLLIINECLIAECLEKDICSIVLTSDIVVPPSSNCLCEDLRSACDREHTKVLELEAEISKQKQLISESEKRFAFLEQNYVSLQLKFQNYKQCIDTSSASNAIFEINKLRQQLQGKDDTIRNLDAQINIMKVLNVGSTEGSCDQQALETDRIQLKDTITSLRIQLDGLKIENVSMKRRYDELSKANNHSRIAYTEKLSALTAGNNQLKAQVTGKTSSGPSTSEKPKVLASGMYTNSSKYIPPPKRANWVKPTPLPKKKQVTFQEPPRTSNRPTQKPPVQQNKKPNVPVNLSTRTKPATESRKPMPKSHTRNHPWRPTGKVVGSVKPQWKPIGRHFALLDNCPLTRIMEPIVEPLELTPSVSSSSKVTMISRFPDCKLSDRKAGSKGISVEILIVCKSTDIWFREQQAYGNLVQYSYCMIGIRALSYRELGCIRRRPTLGLLVLPSVLPNPPTIRRTARISIPPIEPNLAERARIAAINLDDYQLDPLTPPPSPSSLFTMAAYQRMIAETDPTQREEALTKTGQNSVLVPETALTDVQPRVEESSLETLSVDELVTQLRQLCEDAEDRASNAQEEARLKRKEALEEVKMAPGRRPNVNRNPPANRSTNRNNVDINSGIDTQMLNQLIATRVAEALAAAAVTHAASTQEENNLGSNSSQNKTCNYKEFRSVMHEKRIRGTEGAVGLTQWFEKLESQFRG